MPQLTLHFPPQCCRCLEAATSAVAVNTSVSDGAALHNYMFAIPMCESCVARTARVTAIMGTIAAVVGLSVPAIMYWLGGRTDGPWYSELAVAAGIALVVGGATFFGLDSLVQRQAVKVGPDGLPVFRNSEYQRQFEALNRG